MKRISWILLFSLFGLLPSCDRTDLRDGPSASSLQPDRGLDSGPLLPCEVPPTTDELQVRVNEVVLMNDSVLADEDGDFVPWIELFNFTTDQEFHLGGTTLSFDDPFFSNTQTWEFPCIDDVILGPGEYLIVFLDGDADDPDDLHASIEPDLSSDLLILLNDGSDVVQIAVSDVEADVALGVPDGAPDDFGPLDTPTPGSANSSPQASTEAMFVRGDVDENFLVDAMDVTLLGVLVFDPSAWGPCPDRLDANNDGGVDLLDVSFLSLQVASPMPMIAPPFPDPGFDSGSPDDLACEIP